ENRQITGISGEAMAHLAQIDWPGNIRQLENAVYRAVVMSEGDQLDLHDFPLLASQPQSATEIPTAPLMLEPMASATMVSGNEIPIAPLPLAG
ncbi:hypothetical protein ABTL85_19040, partial [Acinetobacter baumannii]